MSPSLRQPRRTLIPTSGTRHRREGCGLRSGATLLSKERSPVLDARKLLVDHLDVVQRAIGFAARRYRLAASDAEELGGEVKLRLVENDYAIVRAYEGRSSFRTFIGVVVQRMALDYCIHAWGKWHASAEAKRLGALAVALEELLYRDGRTLEEAVPILQAKHEGVSLASLQALEAKLRKPPPRPQVVDVDGVAERWLARPPDADEAMLADERRRESQEISRLVSAFLARLPEQDRLIFQLRFEH
ncbi:MAG: hypothetical protein QOJ98_405, partial [Acidobacteriota bacterium]|nr:hypothetical protein [Acidobacteriota bacterium]